MQIEKEPQDLELVVLHEEEMKNVDGGDGCICEFSCAMSAVGDFLIGVYQAIQIREP